MPEPAVSSVSAAAKKGRPRRTDWQASFLEIFRMHGVQAWAANAVKISVDTVAEERKRTPEFAREYEEAFEYSTAVLEYTSHRWGSTGLPVRQTVTKEVVQIKDGAERVVERTTTVTESLDRSAALAIFMLKSRRPEVYRERLQVEQTGAEGGPLEIRISKEEMDAAVGGFDAEVVRLADARRAREGAASGGAG